MEGLPKVAIFLLIFALVALVFELFYFRRKKTEAIPKAPQTVPKHTPRFVNRSLIIIGLLFLFLGLPASLYVASQRVTVEKEATEETPQSPAFGCAQIDFLHNKVATVSVVTDQLVHLVGYCFVESANRQYTIDTLRFELTRPGGQIVKTEQLAFPDKEKTTATRRVFKATQPNIKLSAADTYTIKVLAFSSQLGYASQAFTRTLVVSAGEEPSTTPTPQTISELPRTGNSKPTCESISAIPLTGPSPLTVSFTGVGSDPDNDPISFDFTFGDGRKQTVGSQDVKEGKASLTHVYETARTYNASLRVRDRGGRVSDVTNLCSVEISVVTASSATASGNLRAQPTKTTSPTPTTAVLPQVGVSVPMLGIIAAGMLLLTLGLLLAL